MQTVPVIRKIDRSPFEPARDRFLRHFLQYEILDRLHCRPKLLQVELYVALRDVARAVVQQSLRGGPLSTYCRGRDVHC
jgi:hypothetical protein